jgi:hypothetical protein
LELPHCACHEVPAIADGSSELTLVKILAHNETHISHHLLPDDTQLQWQPTR